MTSVLPSQWPRESPNHWRMSAGRCGTAVHDDAALPALALADVVDDRDAARRLHDAAEAAAAIAGAELRQAEREAAVRQRTVLRPVMAVHARGVVARRKLVASRRRRRDEFAPGTAGQPKLAGLRRLHHGEAELAIGGSDLLRLRRHCRDAAVRWVDHHRRTGAGALERAPYVVVGAGDVALAAAHATVIAAVQIGPYAVEFRPLRLGEEFLVREFRRALERRIGFVGPDTLQIGVAPRRLQCGRRCRGSLGQRRAGRHRDAAEQRKYR